MPSLKRFVIDSTHEVAASVEAGAEGFAGVEEDGEGSAGVEEGGEGFAGVAEGAAQNALQSSIFAKTSAVFTSPVQSDLIALTAGAHKKS